MSYESDENTEVSEVSTDCAEIFVMARDVTVPALQNLLQHSVVPRETGNLWLTQRFSEKTFCLQYLHLPAPRYSDDIGMSQKLHPYESEHLSWN